MKEKATNYYKNGFSCSESIIKTAIDEGLCDKSLLAVSTAFSGGMASGCLCGAVAGAQMVIGYNYGKNNSENNEEIARLKAAQFMEKFKEKRKTTCCRALSAGLTPEQKRENCTNLVGECAEILESMVKIKV